MSAADVVKQIERDMRDVCAMDKIISGGNLDKLSPDEKLDPEFQRVFKMWNALNGSLRP